MVHNMCSFFSCVRMPRQWQGEFTSKTTTRPKRSTSTPARFRAPSVSPLVPLRQPREPLLPALKTSLRSSLPSSSPLLRALRPKALASECPTAKSSGAANKAQYSCNTTLVFNFNHWAQLQCVFKPQGIKA